MNFQYMLTGDFEVHPPNLRKFAVKSDDFTGEHVTWSPVLEQLDIQSRKFVGDEKIPNSVKHLAVESLRYRADGFFIHASEFGKSYRSKM
jgi:hypothetical protein